MLFRSVVVMGDVAVTLNPTADQLAQIAYTTAHTAQSVAGITDPQIAMLSFSTKENFFERGSHSKAQTAITSRRI